MKDFVRENSARGPGLVSGLRVRMLFVVGTLSLLTMVGLLLAQVYGVPHTAFEGMEAVSRDHAFQVLNLVADRKKEFLSSWIKERLRESEVLGDQPVLVGSSSDPLTGVSPSQNTAVPEGGLAGQQDGHRSFRELFRLVQKGRTSFLSVDVVDGESGMIVASSAQDRTGVLGVDEKFFKDQFRPGVESAFVVAAGRGSSAQPEFLLSRRTQAARNSPDGPFLQNAFLVFHLFNDTVLKSLLDIGSTLGQKAELLLMDASGRVIGSNRLQQPSGEAGTLFPDRMKEGLALRAASGQEGSVETVSPGGEPILVAFRYIEVAEGYGWGLSVQVDRAEVMAPVRAGVVVLRWIVANGVVFLLGLTWWFTSGLTKSLRILRDGVERVGEGNLTRQVPVVGGDEIGMVGRAFNEMVASIRQRMEELEATVQARELTLNETNEDLLEVRGLLAASEEQYRRLLESTNAVPWEYDLKTHRFTYVGPQIEKIFGFPVGTWENMDIWFGRIHPADRKASLNACMNAIHKGLDHDLHYRAETADGRHIRIHCIVSVAVGLEGPERLIGFFIDITDMERQAIPMSRLERPADEV